MRSNNDLTVDHKFMVPHFNWNNEKKGISFELFENKFIVEDEDSKVMDSLLVCQFQKSYL